MIVLFSGTPGSGKSLHAAQEILDKAALGRPIIANFEISLPHKRKYRNAYVDYVPDEQLQPDRLIAFSRDWFQDHRFGEDRILLVIDEAQRMFNAREWDVKGRKAWLEFFALHRHYGYKVILVAQFDRMLDRQIRCLIESNFIHRKCANFGLAGAIFSLCTMGQLFVAVEMWYGNNMRIGATWFHYRRRLGAVYDSYRTFAPEPVTPGGQGVPSADPAPERRTGAHSHAVAPAPLLSRRQLLAAQLVRVLQQRSDALSMCDTQVFYQKTGKTEKVQHLTCNTCQKKSAPGAVQGLTE